MLWAWPRNPSSSPPRRVAPIPVVETAAITSRRSPYPTARGLPIDSSGRLRPRNLARKRSQKAPLTAVMTTHSALITSESIRAADQSIRLAGGCLLGVVPVLADHLVEPASMGVFTAGHFGVGRFVAVTAGDV